MKNFILPLLIFLSLTAFIPTTNTISGLVKDKDSGKPLSGVLISSISGKHQVNTDKNGRYSIDIESTERSLKFSLPGYYTATIKLNGSKSLNISMAAKKPEILKEIAAEPELNAIAMPPSRSEDRASAKTISSRPLSGRVPGVAIASDKKGKTSDSYLKEEKTAKEVRPMPRRKESPQSNQLTAGEWNDLDHWDFWKDLMNNQDWSTNQPRWQLYLDNRISVNLKNKQQQPLINYTVMASANGTPLWKAQTNFEGKAELWPSLFNNQATAVTLSITDLSGKEVYNKNFSKNIHQINISLDRKAEKIKNLDVLFMVDATGSMGDEISYLKSELEDIIGRLNGGNNLNTRTGLVFYRDHGDDYIVRDFGFDKNISNVKRNLSNQDANGGGDFEEAVEEAMENAINQQQWSTAGTSARLMFMILDAPPHHDAARVKSLQRSIKTAAAKGITLIPVVASGIDKNTEFLMRFMALSTNGTYVFLTDDSGIGNSHLKPTVGSYQVEYLNQLLNRLINKYAGLESNVAEDLLSSAKNK